MSSKTKGVVMVRGPERGQCAELPILADGGPLCVAPVYNWVEDRRYEGLYFIYHKRCAMRIGPWYPHIPFAVDGMKKALGLGRHLWTYDSSWYDANLWLMKWVWDNLGHPHDLFGGQWIGKDGKPMTREEFAAGRE